MLGIALWLEFWGVIQILAWSTEDCSASSWSQFWGFPAGIAPCAAQCGIHSHLPRRCWGLEQAGRGKVSLPMEQGEL